MLAKETAREPGAYQSPDEAVRDIFGAGVAIQKRQPVSGGDINGAYRLLLSNGEEAFLKQNAHAGEGFFAAEAHGLEAMRAAGANVPDALAYGAGGKGFLLLAFVRSGPARAGYWPRLGEMLAGMHRAGTGQWTKGGKHGFYEDNFIGATPQKNAPRARWAEFFRDARLGAQMRLAEHYLDREDRRLCTALLDCLESLLPEPPFPSLLHGDLWGGNAMPDAQGNPMLIDPAAYVGHHEADLAMTELFGRFAPAFYDAYHEIVPREPGYAERRDIYNLYHLLNHLNLFGGSYLSPVRRILRRYAGQRA